MYVSQIKYVETHTPVPSPGLNKRKSLRDRFDVEMKNTCPRNSMSTLFQPFTRKISHRLVRELDEKEILLISF